MDRPRPDACRDDAPLRPVVDPARCNGSAACVAACPYQVFEVRRMDDATFSALPLRTRLSALVRGRKMAYTPWPKACHSCGECVSACPEHAIRLERRTE